MTAHIRETHRWALEIQDGRTHKVCVDCGARNEILGGVDYNDWRLNGKLELWCPTPKARTY